MNFVKPKKLSPERYKSLVDIDAFAESIRDKWFEMHEGEEHVSED
jgi:hypothetical protein